MKVNIDWDEWYPYYFITERVHDSVEVEVSELNLARWTEAIRTINKVQAEMAAAVQVTRNE